MAADSTAAIKMKSFVYEKYGSPDVLHLRDIDKPVVTDEDVLVRVQATSVNPVDWHTMTGTPYIARLSFGLTKPKSTRCSARKREPSRSMSVFHRIEHWYANRPT